MIEAGNPGDALDVLAHAPARHIGFYGEAPRQTAADGGFASRHNLGQAKASASATWRSTEAGLRVRTWSRELGLSQAAQLPSRHRCRHLVLNRAYGLARCVWRGLDHFRAYVWSSVVAYNLALFARLKPADLRSPCPHPDWPSPGRTLIPIFRKYTAGSAHATATANEMAPKRPSSSPNAISIGQKIMRLWTDTS